MQTSEPEHISTTRRARRLDAAHDPLRARARGLGSGDRRFSSCCLSGGNPYLHGAAAPFGFVGRHARFSSGADGGGLSRREDPTKTGDGRRRLAAPAARRRLQGSARAGHPASARLRPLALGQPRPRRRSRPGNAAEGLGGAQALPGRHQHARLDLHHPAATCSSARCAAPASRASGTSSPPPRLLAAPASQDRHIELGDMQRALLHLPQPQREALILVGAGGFAYEEAAEICGCAVGTIKSRVARGRVALEQLLVERQAALAPATQDRSRQVGAADDHGRGRRAEPRPRLRRMPGEPACTPRPKSVQLPQQIGEIAIATVRAPRPRRRGEARP